MSERTVASAQPYTVRTHSKHRLQCTDRQTKDEAQIEILGTKQFNHKRGLFFSLEKDEREKVEKLTFSRNLHI